MKNVNEGTMLELVVADDISWAKEGDKMMFLRKSKDYETNKAVIVLDAKDKTHCIKEYRVAEAGNASAIKRAKANAPKFFAVLQDSCRNFRGERAVVGLENAEELAKGYVSMGEPHTIYELKAVRKVSKEPQITNA